MHNTLSQNVALVLRTHDPLSEVDLRDAADNDADAADDDDDIFSLGRGLLKAMWR